MKTPDMLLDDLELYCAQGKTALERIPVEEDWYEDLEKLQEIVETLGKLHEDYEQLKEGV